MDIYIKPKKKATLSERNIINVQDVADVVCAEAHVVKKINTLVVRDIINDENKKNYLVSVTDIIQTIMRKYPDYTVNNVGETDTWVQYSVKKTRDLSVWKWTKIAFVCVVLLVGSSTAIMAFHTDAQIPGVFDNYFRLLTGRAEANPRIITIPYAIGLAVGIIAFYNHFMGKKITDDPTPVEVEMELYETHVTQTMVDLMEIREKKIGKLPQDDKQ
ncbi:MAG: stage V sporulation protein AA [Defluviitaleaceae bacterium]|nr:stage V sporulation protein AA [Defluviitaleaceae bacterium]